MATKKVAKSAPKKTVKKVEKPMKKTPKKVVSAEKKSKKKVIVSKKVAEATKKPKKEKAIKKAPKKTEKPKSDTVVYGFKRGPKKEGEEPEDRPMTPKQHEVLVKIADSTRSGLPPTLRELADHFGHTSSKACAQSIEALEKRGLVARTGNKARGIAITPAGCKFLDISNSSSFQLCIYTDDELAHEMKEREKLRTSKKPKVLKSAALSQLAWRVL